MSEASASIAGSSSSYAQFNISPFGSSVTTRPESRQSTATNQPRPLPFQQSHDLLRSDNGHSIPSSHYAMDPSFQSANPTPQPSTMPAPSSTRPSPPTNKPRPTSKSKPVSQPANSKPPAPPPQQVRREGKLGPHKDGRVRNPVPRKLKGKTDDKNGNFAVMHMDMIGTESASPIPRAEAAQRTSENTANAARTAQKEGYIPMKKRKVLATATVPAPMQTGDHNLQSPELGFGSAKMNNLPGLEYQGRRRSELLNAQETKHEQARLLTLLRSLTPITVVDQICTALAFFGGIPGAPPPESGEFPESAEANGSGRLFIGWLSELFPIIPNLERKEVRDDEIDRGRRPRGRPKGSKATKARKDKGIKKGPKQSNEDFEDDEQDDDDESGDVEEGESNMDDSRISMSHVNSMANGGQFGAQALYQPPTTTTALRSTLVDDNHLESAPTMANMGKRRPGRQKGDDGNEEEVETSTMSSYYDPNLANSAASGTFRPPQATTSNHFPVHVQDTGRGAPSTSTLPARIDPSLLSTSQPPSQPPSQVSQGAITAQPAKRSRAKVPSKGAASKANDKQPTPPPESSMIDNPGPGSTGNQIISVPPITAQKRKRNRAKTTKDDAIAVPMTQPEERSNNVALLPPVSGHLQTSAGPGRESPIPPPAKRQRKPKDSPSIPHRPEEKNTSLNTSRISGSPHVNHTPIPQPKPLQNIQPSTFSPLTRQMQPTPLQQFMPKQATSFDKPLPQYHSSALPKQSAMSQGSQFPHINQPHTSGQTQSPGSQNQVINNISHSQPLGNQQPSSNMQKPMSMSMMFNPTIDIQPSPSSHHSATQHMTPPIQQSSSNLDFKSAPQPLLSAGLSQTMNHVMPSSSIPSNMGSVESLLSTTRPQSTRPSSSRTLGPGLEPSYDTYNNMQYDTPPQTHQHQHRLSLSNNSLSRISPTSNPALNSSMGSSINSNVNSSAFFQPQPLVQHHQQSRQSPFNTSNFSTQQPTNVYVAHSQPTLNNNLYRTSQPQHSVHDSPFAPRRPSQHQQQAQQYYQFANDATTMDLPALDSLSQNPLNNSASNLNSNLGSNSISSYGQTMHNRNNSANYASLSGTPGLSSMSGNSGNLAPLPNMLPNHHHHQPQHDFMSGASGAQYDMDFRSKSGGNMGSLGGRR